MLPEYLSPLANHVWQSTLFAAAAGLLTLAFKKNRAPVRYGLWLAASIKFLVPFSLLVAMGQQVGWRTTPPSPRPDLSYAIEGIGQPFAPSSQAATVPPAPSRAPAVLFSVWFCGFLLGAGSWLRDWLRVRAVVRAASPLALPLPIPALSSPARIEPGIFGILKPVLLLPDGIADHLTPAQFEAVVAHELCHVRRRDNLAAALHMVVEAIFWFHPLVWWLEARLVEERERACDEEVLRLAAEPRVYAEGILNVCKFYVSSPLVCVSGVTGSNLKQRIEAIMNHRMARNLTFGKKLLLALVLILAVAAPVTIGLIGAPAAQAQAKPLAFEVASVKANNTQVRGMEVHLLPGGRFVAHNLPLRVIVTIAYDLPFQSNRLSGAPETEPILRQNYDIEATAEKGALPAGASVKVREETIKSMVRTLLADRFKMTVRRDTKDTPVYAIVVAKNGPKLQPATIAEKDCPETATGRGGGCHMLNGGQGRGLHAIAADVSDVALFVSNWTDRPTIDRTGLTGLYEFNTTGWTSMQLREGVAGVGEDGIPETDRPTLFMVMSQLGLRLDTQRAPVDFFVVTHVEKPVEN
jgi:bla regulator protein BlaR1